MRIRHYQKAGIRLTQTNYIPCIPDIHKIQLIQKCGNIPQRILVMPDSGAVRKV
ncbi:hypothetical protein OMAG_002138 [Candidatus Omnitrophus magneticus]|uniref:Uncharacterized protein n=1 Tax=Candidatus Omnitrophus magneticus TaxID=1609969 RepID=A0A0F0CPP4_9BACT|nr:hypothetical protein OMAG_002138 [Candidatus Omnitrophus magneticus]